MTEEVHPSEYLGITVARIPSVEPGPGAPSLILAGEYAYPVYGNPRCQLCQEKNSRREAVEAAYLQGVEPDVIDHSWGISPRVLKRHFQEHVDPAWRAISAAVDGDSDVGGSDSSAFLSSVVRQAQFAVSSGRLHFDAKDAIRAAVALEKVNADREGKDGEEGLGEMQKRYGMAMRAIVEIARGLLSDEGYRIFQGLLHANPDVRYALPASAMPAEPAELTR